MAITDIIDHRPWPLPPGPWVMHQSWYDFLFLHWEVDPAQMRELVPKALPLDLWEGKCYVGVIPFRMENVRPRGGFNVPGVSSFLELNVRTYVRIGDRTGVYFLSLEANQKAAVEVARAWFDLPYMHAKMSHEEREDTVHYHSSRTDRRGNPAVYRGTHRPHGEPFTAQPGTLEHWLCERYALFTVDRKGTWMGDVHHAPWQLRQAEIDIETQTLLDSHGLTVNQTQPDHVMWSSGVDSVVWTPKHPPESGQPAVV